MNSLVTYLALIAVFDLAAIYFGKMYSLSDKILFMILCSVCFAITGVFFSLSLKFGAAALVNVIWIAVSIILGTILGVLYFKEHVDLLQFVGMGVILVGIILIFSKPVSG